MRRDLIQIVALQRRVTPQAGYYLDNYKRLDGLATVAEIRTWLFRPLVGLKMPRALEVCRTLRTGGDDILLSEELTLRENSRIKTALRM